MYAGYVSLLDQELKRRTGGRQGDEHPLDDNSAAAPSFLRTWIPAFLSRAFGLIIPAQQSSPDHIDHPGTTEKSKDKKQS